MPEEIDYENLSHEFDPKGDDDSICKLCGFMYENDIHDEPYQVIDHKLVGHEAIVHNEIIVKEPR